MPQGPRLMPSTLGYGRPGQGLPPVTTTDFDKLTGEPVTALEGGVEFPPVALPPMFQSPALPIPKPINPNEFDVQGEGLPPEEPKAAGPVPGLSWRWSGQPPSAAEIARDRDTWLANHQGYSDSVREYGAPRRMHEREVEDAVRQARNPAEAAMLRARLNQEWEAGPEGQRYARDRADVAADEDLFSRGLPRAKMQGKIGLEDALVGLRAAMSPEGRQARAMQFEEGITQQMDPRVQQLREAEAARQERLAGIRVMQSLYGSQMGAPMFGLDPLSRLLGVGDVGAAAAGGGGAAPMRGGPAGGPAPSQPAGGGAPAGKVAKQGDVEAFAHENNLMFDQAVSFLKGYGYQVQMNDGSVR